MGRTRKDRRIVGRIIFANFLKLPPDKFDKYIRSVERLPIFTKLLADGIVSVENISWASAVRGFTISEGIIARIVKGKRDFHINYLSDGFTKRYLVTDAVQRDYEVNLLLNKLRHITTRNEFTHQILTSIIKYQKDYFTMGFDANLKILTQKGLSDYIIAFAGLKIDESWISRMVKGKSIISPRGKVLPLKFLFHKRKNIKKGLVKRILDDERSSLKSGNLTRVYSDRKIAEKIKNNYRVEISRRLNYVPNLILKKE